MRHAGPEALARLEPLLRELRAREGLVERSPGIFYRRSRAFLHFHEDPSGLYADVRLGSDWSRHPVRTRAEQRALLRRVDRRLEPRPRGGRASSRRAAR